MPSSASAFGRNEIIDVAVMPPGKRVARSEPEYRYEPPIVVEGGDEPIPLRTLNLVKSANKGLD